MTKKKKKKKKKKMFLIAYFSFDEISLKKRCEISCNYFFNVRVILVEANGTRYHLDSQIYLLHYGI